MRWIIPNLLAVLAVSGFFSSVFTRPTGDSEPLEGQSIGNDFVDEFRSYDAPPTYVRREIAESLPGLSRHPNFETHVGYGATARTNTDKSNDDGDAPEVDQVNLASALEAIHLEGHNHSVVSRGVKEEDEVERSFKSAWKGQTFYCFIDAKDMGSKELAPHEIKNLAEKGYERIKDKFYFNGNVIVSALSIPGVGVAVGSKPRGTGVVDEILDKSHKVSGKNKSVKDWFQRYWIKVKSRKVSNLCGSISQEDLYHAEDLVMIKGADEYLKKQGIKEWGMRIRFPQGTHMVTYGKYNSDDKLVGPKEPCGGTQTSKLSVPCKEVAKELDIAWST
ncbi:hypothetical protein BDV40DRAFT_306488 [Aspergillus tamarii]|uniref:Uncharacterized protein n=1 Tax=Aspergillus tamarii TaxID=41984 RepID=A0A5N6UBR8_ASPTM|nr:hypothetical protein BDV40DRAFT_306488 [Aspergillus tamarii]